MPITPKLMEPVERMAPKFIPCLLQARTVQLSMSDESGTRKKFEKGIMMFHQYVTSVSRRTNETHSETFSFYIAGAIGSTIGILHKWTAENFQSDSKDVADIMSRIFLSGVLPYID